MGFKNLIVDSSQKESRRSFLQPLLLWLLISMEMKRVHFCACRCKSLLLQATFELATCCIVVLSIKHTFLCHWRRLSPLARDKARSLEYNDGSIKIMFTSNKRAHFVLFIQCWLPAARVTFTATTWLPHCKLHPTIKLEIKLAIRNLTLNATCFTGKNGEASLTFDTCVRLWARM